MPASSPTTPLRNRQPLLSPRIKVAVPSPPAPSSRCRLEWRSEIGIRGRGAVTDARAWSAPGLWELTLPVLAGRVEMESSSRLQLGLRSKAETGFKKRCCMALEVGVVHDIPAQPRQGVQHPCPPLPLLADLICPAPTLAADGEAEFQKLQQLWPVPPLLTSFLPQKRAAAGGRGGGGEGKGCNNNPKPFHLSSPHIYQQAQFSAALSLSLAHHQMIAQGFAERRHEAAEPASPLPVWGVGGSGGRHIIQRKRRTCFQQWRG